MLNFVIINKCGVYHKPKQVSGSIVMKLLYLSVLIMLIFISIDEGFRS